MKPFCFLTGIVLSLFGFSACGESKPVSLKCPADCSEVTGTISEIRLEDVNKRGHGHHTFHTYLTLKVESTSPLDLKERLNSQGQKFMRKSDEVVDRALKVGDRITVTMSPVSIENQPSATLGQVLMYTLQKH